MPGRAQSLAGLELLRPSASQGLSPLPDRSGVVTWPSPVSSAAWVLPVKNVQSSRALDLWPTLRGVGPFEGSWGCTPHLRLQDASAAPWGPHPLLTFLDSLVALRPLVREVSHLWGRSPPPALNETYACWTFHSGSKEAGTPRTSLWVPHMCGDHQGL